MDERDRQARSGARRVGAAIGHDAFVERIDAREDLDQRGLAGAVLAEQRDDLAGIDMHADIGQRLGSAELLGNVLDDQKPSVGRSRGRIVCCHRLPAGIHGRAPPVMPVHPPTTAPPCRAAKLRFRTLGTEC